MATQKRPLPDKESARKEVGRTILDIFSEEYVTKAFEDFPDPGDIATVDATVPKNASIITKTTAYEVASTDGAKIINCEGGTFAVNLPDGLPTGFQVAIAPVSGTITLTADTTLQYWDAGVLTTAGGAVTLDQGPITVYHNGSNVWRIFGSVTE